MSDNDNSSSGFEIIEKLLEEGRPSGRSATLDGWISEAKQRLSQVRQSGDARAKEQAGKVQQAYDAAAELVNGILSGQIQGEKRE